MTTSQDWSPPEPDENGVWGPFGQWRYRRNQSTGKLEGSVLVVDGWIDDMRGDHAEVADAFIPPLPPKPDTVVSNGHTFTWREGRWRYPSGRSVHLDSEVSLHLACALTDLFVERNNGRQPGDPS